MQHARVISSALLAAVGLTTVHAAHGSSPALPHTGRATTTITLPAITVTDPGGGTRTINLGSLIAQAANETAPGASLALAGPAALGAALPGWTVDTASGPQSGDHDIVLSSSPVSGDVGLDNYDVHADPTSASASYGALSASAATTPVSVQADLGQHGVSANVTPDGSTGTLELTVSGLQIRLGDLLPASVLDALPLSGLVDIVNSLGLPMPVGAGSVDAALAALTSDLSAAQKLAGQLATARTALATLLAALPGTAAAQQQLTAAQATLSSDLAALQSAQQQLAADTATMQQLQTQVTSLAAAVTAAQQQVDTANASVASWTAQVNSLTSQINSLLGNPLNAAQIAALTVQLDDAQTQLTAAQAQLASAESSLASAQAALAPVQTQLTQATAAVNADQALVTSTQQQVATDQAAVTAAQQALDALVGSITNDPAVTDAQALVNQLTTSLTAIVSTLSSDIAALPDLTALRNQLLSALTSAPLVNVGSLGATLSSTADDNGGTGVIACTITGASVLGHSIPAGSCSDLVGHFAAITTAVAGALDQLPLATPASPRIGGLAQQATSTTPTATDTTTNGSASVTPLRLSLPSTTLAALADTTVTALGSALTHAQQSFSALGLPALTSALSGSLGTLAGTVTALPTGTGLAGLRTLGIDASMVGLSTAAVHNLAPSALPTPTPTPAPGGSGSGTVGGGTPGATPSPTTPPGDGPPRVQTTQHDPLPFTGGDAAVEFAAALILLLGGAHLMRLGRRRA